MKRRQTGPRDGEERQSPAEEQKKELSITAGSAGLQLSWLSLLCLSVPLLFSWLYLQQDARLADMTQKYESLVERSRGAEQLEEKLKELSLQLQASADAVTLLSALKLSVSSVLHTSAELQEDGQSSSLRTHTLQQLLQSLTEQRCGRHTEVSDELQALKTQTRATHTRVTEDINDVDGRLRKLRERLQELEDGIRRNTRVLDRTEEEDTQRVKDLLNTHTRRLKLLHDQLRRLTALKLQLMEKMDTSAPHTHTWQETQLPQAEECVRSLLRLRAQMSRARGRLEESTQQLTRAQDTLRRSRSAQKQNTPAQLEYGREGFKDLKS